jgi:hypothetical protein
VPFLFVEGTGTFVLTGLRARPAPDDPAAVERSRNEALRWAPLRIGHATINFLDASHWIASSDLLVTDLLGGIFLAAAIGGTLAYRAWKRRWRPGPFVAGAAVAVALAGNAIFAVRAAPAVALAPSLDPALRLAAWRDFAAELGPLAALARGQVGPGESVGVLAKRSDWFGWETLCFHLAPRRCVQVLPERPEHAGLQGVDRLRWEQIDVLLVFHPEAPLPPGWVPVAVLNRNSFVARRR